MLVSVSQQPESRLKGLQKNTGASAGEGTIVAPCGSEAAGVRMLGMKSDAYTDEAACQLFAAIADLHEVKMSGLTAKKAEALAASLARSPALRKVDFSENKGLAPKAC